MDLETYYQTPEWQAKRTRRLEIDEYECRLCGATEQLEVHHKPKCYPLIPNERVEDLTTLCKACHEEVATNTIRRARYERQVIASTDVERKTPQLERTSDPGQEVISGVDSSRVTPPIEGRSGEDEKVTGEDYGRITPPMSQRKTG